MLAVVALLLAGSLAGATITATFTAAPAAAAPQGFTTIGKGGDSCTAPSVSQMSAFFRNTPYLAWGIYIGGKDRACSQPNLTASWVSQVTGQGWALLPLWVGPQNPCLAGFDHFSTNTSTAYAQGQNEAKAAYNALVGLGMSSNSPIIYDMEAGGSNTSTCINATKSFVQGWVNQLAVPPAQPSGIYTSTCAGFLDNFASLSPPPKFVDGADYD
ncbi:MAG: glycoside hydrolase domain-containing protein, partial [Jatrophihabitantaceae bacterium]